MSLSGGKKLGGAKWKSIRFDRRWVGDHGIGRFAREIESRLPELFCADLDGRPSDPIDCVRTWLWLVRNRNKILFTPGYNAPIFYQSRCIITVHDLNHIDAPVRKSLLKGLYYRVVLKRACRNALNVLTVSEFSRQRIINWSGASLDRVVNVGNGISSAFTPEKVASPLEDLYFLSVSNRKPHKNERRVFDAFGNADLPKSVKLIVTGEATSEQRDWLIAHGLARRIIFVGHISDHELAEYYRGAICLLFMSLYEGFGLPAVEAMACGTPVVVSNVTSLPEVVGDAGLQLDPRDVPELTRVMEALYHDQKLRSDMSTRGLERVTQFRWSKVADRLRSCLDSV